MTYDTADAVYALNSYINKALTVNLGWTPVTYTNSLGDTVKATPIIPSQQQPEFLATNKTFLVYGSAVQPMVVPGLHSEYIVYTVWSPTVSEANKTANLIHDLFIIREQNADNINTWLDLEMDASTTHRDRFISFTDIRTG